MSKSKIPVLTYALDGKDSLFVDCISFVDSPAVESSIEFFAKEKAAFAIVGKHAITPVIRANHKILRERDGNLYYVVFTKETCDYLMRQMMKDASEIRWTSNHDDSPAPDGVTLTGLFQTSSAVSVKGFEDIDEGSIFATFAVEDASTLENFGGVSVELYYDDLIPVEADAFTNALTVANELCIE